MTGRVTTAQLGLRAESPAQCTSLADVRQALDAIDAEVIALLGMRLGYVLAAAQFKPTLASIPAPERVAEMLVARQAWGEAAGLPCDFTGPVFAQISQWFIQQQTRHWQDTRHAAAKGTVR